MARLTINTTDYKVVIERNDMVWIYTRQAGKFVAQFDLSDGYNYYQDTIADDELLDILDTFCGRHLKRPPSYPDDTLYNLPEAERVEREIVCDLSVAEINQLQTALNCYITTLDTITTDNMLQHIDGLRAIAAKLECIGCMSVPEYEGIITIEDTDKGTVYEREYLSKNMTW